MSRSPARRAKPVAAVVAAALTGLGLAVTVAPSAHAATPAPNYDLAVALQQSLYFYDAQKSGPARSLGVQPLEWRGDSEPSDSAVPLTPMKDYVGTNLSQAFIDANRAVLDPAGKGTLDLSGGFHDAGDHVKFGLPQTYAASTVAWGLYEFPDAVKATHGWEHGLEELTWFSDYFLRSTFRNASGDVVAFAYQVGEGSIDHDYWGPSELQSPTKYPRPAYFATADTPASDQTAGAAAALAAHAAVVTASDPAYAAKLLDTAQALYRFSVAHRGLGYSGGFYGSGYDDDELAWAAAWLYVATGRHTYLDDVLAVNADGTYTGWLKKIVRSTTETWQNIWVHSWDAKWGGVFGLLDPFVQADAATPQPVKDAVHYFDRWQVEFWSHVPHDNASDTSYVPNTPAGFGFLTTWGSARYNTAAQLEALAYRKHFPADAKSTAFADWALGQMNYVMGDNPLKRSYIVGFGSTTPGAGPLVGGTATAAQHPHHADAHGSLDNDQDKPSTDKHILWGGLVGGPASDDSHNDVTTDYVLNEVAVDYDAALPGAIAGLYQFYGAGQATPVFTPPAEPTETPYYATAKLNRAGDQGTQLTVSIANVATHPPAVRPDLSLRYYFDIKPLVGKGQSLADISTPIFYDESKQVDGTAATLSAPVRWGGANSCVYYVTVAWTGIPVWKTRDFQFAVNAAQAPDYANNWDSTPSPSFTGLAAKTYESTPDPYIPVYVDGKLAFGQEPSLTADEGCGPTGGGTGGGGTATTALAVKYAASGTAASSQDIRNTLEVVNTGTAPVDLSKVTVRYWFTRDGADPLEYHCDYAPVGCAAVTGTFAAVSPARTGADTYLQLSFGSGAGTLGAGKGTGAIQNRVNHTSYTVMNQADDYSFSATTTSATVVPKVTVYLDGALVAGVEP